MPPSTSATTLKRIHREIADLKREDLGALALAPSEDSLFNWTATIPGPEGSVYEGGVFHADVVLSPDYPFSAPRVTFRTRIYHMNINERGNICIDILKHNWSPALSLFKVILSLSSLLTDPNPKDPLVPSIATEYLRNRHQHDATARRWTELYARPPLPSTATSTKAKGKSRADDLRSASSPVPGQSRAGSVSTAGSSEAEAITIEDSDEERNGSGLVRTVAKNVVGMKRKRGTGEEGSVDSVVGETREARRRRTGAARVLPEEVIVIED